MGVKVRPALAGTDTGPVDVIIMVGLETEIKAAGVESRIKARYARGWTSGAASD